MMPNLRAVLQPGQEVAMLKILLPKLLILRTIDEAELIGEFMRRGYTRLNIEQALSELKTEGKIQEV